MDGFQLSQGYRATARRQFTFYHSVPRSFWYLFNQPRKDERLSGPRSHPVVLNPGYLHRESNALTASHFQTIILKKTEIFQISYGFPALKI